MVLKYTTSEGHKHTVTIGTNPASLTAVFQKAIKAGATEVINVETGEELLQLPF